DYEKQLADAAHPLEEKAIAVHEKNLELMRRGLSNTWTQKSLDRLAALEPDTYARTEISSGFLGSLERYVYQPPPRAVEEAPSTPAPPTTAKTAPGAKASRPPPPAPAPQTATGRQTQAAPTTATVAPTATALPTAAGSASAPPPAATAGPAGGAV